MDDAEILDRGTCAVEAWTARTSARDWSAILSPVCHLLPGVEITGELEVLREGGERARNLGIEGKTILREVGGPGIGGIGIGLLAGGQVGLDGGGLSDLYAAVPVSLDALPDLRINATAGWVWDRADRSHAASWAVGLDWSATGALDLIAETFGEQGRHPAYQIGIRPWLIADRLHLDLVYGRNLVRPGSDTATFGLVAIF